MKKKTKDHYKEIIDSFIELKQRYPTYSLGMHISTILDEYKDIWGLPDREFMFALTKYKARLEMDVPRETSDRELEQILKDGMNLSLTLEED